MTTTDRQSRPLSMGEHPLSGFALATVAAQGPGVPGDLGRPALVVGGELVDLRSAAESAGVAPAPDEPRYGMMDLLEDWDRSLDKLCLVAAFIEQVGLDDERLRVLRSGVRLLPPITRPSKMVYAAQNYADHVKEMRDAQRFGFNPGEVAQSKEFNGLREGTHPYVFLKAPSSLTGPYDDIEIPPEVTEMDWEVELAVVIGRRATRVSSADALHHVAGYMSTNDFSARNLLFRPDRERLRSDWFGGKSHDGFAPMGPVLVPAMFVPDHLDLRLRLTVNGQTRQDGNTSNLIFTPEEQIEFASRMTTLIPGDILATGTPGGVGQGTNSFLSPGDVVEAEVQGLGVIRNQIVRSSLSSVRGAVA